MPFEPHQYDIWPAVSHVGICYVNALSPQETFRHAV